MKTKKIKMLFILIFLINITSAQRVQIRYDEWGLSRFVALNGLNFPQYFPKNNVINIDDSLFVNEIFKIINNFEKCDSCGILNSTTVQIIYIDENIGYEIINMMYYSQLTPKYRDFGNMELNGKPVFFNKNLQFVIENIISYYYIKDFNSIPPKKYIRTIANKL